jgi:hypothetical protein
VAALMEHNKKLETALYENFARMAFAAAEPGNPFS